ncbi:MAG: hypothetical protein MJY88_02905 [Bacteroidales bacterium]|nr:hypothetical protein [Bacteroidales bacterium]
MDKERERYYLDDMFGEHLLISNQADARELGSNVRAARAILNSFPEVYITIRPHRIHLQTKNPEYTICEQIGDRKGICSEKGVTAGFKSAKKQGCKVVVIDLDEHSLQVDAFELSKYIARRKADFITGAISECYVVFQGNAVRVNGASMTRVMIERELNLL